MTAVQSARAFEGTQIPPSGTYAIDPSHSHVGFVARHLVVAKVRGRFTDFDGRIVVADDPTDSSVEVRIGAASVTTNDDQRDGHLRSADFFDVEQFPELRFSSTAVRHLEGDRWEVDGDLTIRDVTRPVTLALTFEGLAADPWGGSRAGFAATTRVDRESFGLTWNQPLEAGGVLVGKEVTIELEVEAVLEA